uniref:DDE Tnp4 domain-containing protein n=1 Tax=Erpetoichthys calabaricus TaxID=27687 RepID=A0A8C4XGT5_ERPCA
MSTEKLLCILMLLRRIKKRQKQRHRRRNVRPLNISRHYDGEYSSLVLPTRQMDVEKHHEYFRISAIKFDYLLQRIKPYIKHRCMHIDPVGPAVWLAVTLRYLATGISLRALAASYKLGTSTVCNIVAEVCQAIWAVLKDEFVAFPDTEQWKNIKQDFWSLWHFPNCLGAKDGKHVRVCAPCHTGSAFFNYKGYFTFILMVVCDARYRFTVVDIGAYGRDSDAGVFVRSQFGSQLIQGNLSLLPPSTLPSSEVLSPHVYVIIIVFHILFTGTNLTPEQRIYNYRHSRARRDVENAFGILAARWRIFGKDMECSVDRAQDITKACICLHNYLCAGDSMEPDGARYVSRHLVDEGDIPGEWRCTVDGDSNLTSPGRLTGSRATRTGTLVCDCLKEYFQTVAGKVTFQDAVLHRGTVN